MYNENIFFLGIVENFATFLLSSYEIWESIGFTSGKSKIFFCFFHVLGLIIPKKNFRLSRGVAAVDKNLWSPFLSRIKR
jgi:hypothetical protein